MATPEETIEALLERLKEPTISQEKYVELKSRIEFINSMGR